MKIIHVVLCSAYNDGWSYQDNCLPYYHKQAGNDVTVITTPFINSKDSHGYKFHKTGLYYDENGLKIIRLPLLISNTSRFSMKLRLYKGVYQTLVDEKPDILFVHGSQFLDIKKIVKYVKRHSYVTVFVDGHADHENSARNWISKNIVHKVLWKYCAQIIEPYTAVFWGVLPARVSFLRDVYRLPKEKVKLLVLGAEDEKVKEAKDSRVRQIIRDKHGITDNDFLIVTGGKIDLNKAQTLLLMEAIKNMSRTDVKLLVFGSVVEELRERLTSLICESVQFIGWIDSRDGYKYFESADLVVFPGLHSVYWEQAVGHGKPCVFKYMEGFTHVDLGGNCEFLYEDSVEEISEVLNQIMSDKLLYRHMLDVSEKLGRREFSYREIAKKSISINSTAERRKDSDWRNKIN